MYKIGFFTDKIIVSIFRTFLVLYYLGNPQPGFLPASSDQRQVTSDPKRGAVAHATAPIFYIPNFAMIRASLALVSSFSFFRAST